MKEASTPNAPTEAVSGLALAPGKPIRITRERFGENLERHLALELRIGGLIDLAHAPLTDEGDHVVVRVREPTARAMSCS